MHIEFAGQYDRKTIYTAVMLANKPSKRSTYIRIGVAVLFVIIYAAFYINLASQGTLTLMETARSGRHLITIPFIAIYLFQPYLSAFITARKLWNDPFMREPIRGYFSSHGITYVYSEDQYREFTWQSYAKKHQSENLLVLLTADGLLSFFPRSFFETDTDWRRANQFAGFRVSEPV